ncbi:FecR family protein [Noviherbaspirillum humi]|uniref:FecR family protein n=1 Tax=Noviherbaspirillum humi TaxID=1688639 RepID=A0A239IQ63_9BURK|nr:FecR domain-containing protein [Noviherbaspirillum humi]SNS95183.1 FecR family protein [Noviherbaspirillum humi]
MQGLRKLIFAAACVCLSLSAQHATAAGRTGAVAVEGNQVIYTVAPDETLPAIAEQTTAKAENWRELAKANRLPSTPTVKAGSRLVIPQRLLPEDPVEGNIVSMSGHVYRIGERGAVGTLSADDKITEGMKINLGRKSFLTIGLPDGSRISLPSNSYIRLTRLRMTRFTKSPKTEITLLNGSAELEVNSLKENMGKFEVRTVTWIAGVRGTRFRVHVNNGTTATEVLEGEVAVKHARETRERLLPSGTGLIQNADGKVKMGQLLDPPRFCINCTPPRNGNIVVAIDPVKGAAGYRVRMAADRNMHDVVDESMTNTNEAELKKSVRGTYHIVVTALDVNGMEGKPSVQTHEFKLPSLPVPNPQ